MNQDMITKIVAAIRRYMAEKEISQNKLSAMIGMSAAHMSYVLNESMWDKVSDDKWRQLRARFLPSSWGTYETINYKALQKLCRDTQEASITNCVAAYTGAGKTVGLRAYSESTPNAYFVQADQLMSNKDFLREVQRSMGIVSEGTAREMLMAIVRELEKTERPLLIIDEADKLRDSCLMSLKVIYDRLEGRCGFVTAGTEVLKTRLTKFAQRDKLGYREILRRFGNFKTLRRFDCKDAKVKAEVLSICKDQGIEVEKQIIHIMREADNYGTLRNLIQQIQRLNTRVVETEQLEEVA